MNIHHISDTHTYHDQLILEEEEIDILIHTGDCSNPRDLIKSEHECLDFIQWYASVPIRHKIYIAGNHDLAIERRLVNKKTFEEHGIIYLENESICIKGINIWGSPYSPSFGDGWAFNKRRDKLHDVWSIIPNNTDIVATHTPPKGILDLSYDRDDVLEFCGCEALRKRMFELQPTLCLFGHIHNMKGIHNAGYRKLPEYRTIFSNGSVVTDGKFGQINHNGNTFII